DDEVEDSEEEYLLNSIASEDDFPTRASRFERKFSDNEDEQRIEFDNDKWIVDEIDLTDHLLDYIPKLITNCETDIQELYQLNNIFKVQIEIGKMLINADEEESMILVAVIYILMQLSQTLSHNHQGYHNRKEDTFVHNYVAPF
ncbi:unnamed protein product, partial [Cunninghamella blakesleeana]